MATDQFGNPLDEEELRRQYLHQVAMGIAPHPARTKGLATPPSVDYSQVMQDWSDPVMLSAPAFDAPRPTNVQTSGIAPTWDTNAVAFGNQGVRSFNYSRPSPLPVTPPGTMNMKDFIDKHGPVQSGTRDAYYMPDGTVRNAAGDLVSTETTFDPTVGLAATDPNLQGVTPTSTVSTGLYSEAGVPMSNENLSWFGAAPVPTSPSMNTVDYGPALQAMDVAIPPADLGVTTQPTIPTGITPTDSIIPVADLGGNDSIDVQTQVDDFSGMPSWDTSAVSIPGSDFFGGHVSNFDFVPDPVEKGEIYDVNRHLGLTLGVWPKDDFDISTPKHFLGNLGTLFIEKNRKTMRDYLDDIEQFLDDETTTDKLQDLINNQIAEDIDTSFTNQGLTQLEKYNQGLANPNVVYDKDSLNAMVDLAKDDYYKSEEQVQEAINEIKSGVDTFKDVPTETLGVPDAPAVVRTETISKRELQRLHQEKKDALAAQRKADLARQKAAARRTQIARQALKDSQAAAAKAQAASAAQAKSEQAKAKAVLARMSNDRNTPSSAEVQAAREVLSQVDTFSGGRIRGDRDSGGYSESGMGQQGGRGHPGMR